MKNIAIIGCGGMGGGHARAIASGIGNTAMLLVSDDKIRSLGKLDTDLHSILNLAGIYDISPARVEWAKERGYNIYNSYEEVLNDPDVDIVLIATPNHLHKELSISAMLAGKHVLCEKPVTMNSKELEEIIQVSKETGMVFYPRQNRRWDKDYLIIKKIYDENLLGEVFNIDSRVYGSRGIPSDWRRKDEFGGGMMLDWGVHLLDRLLDMIPEKVTEVFCKMTHVTYNEVDDGFKMQITFESGKTAAIEVFTHNFINLPLWYMAGKKGTVVIDDWSCNGSVVCHNLADEPDAQPIMAGSGLTKTMAPRAAASVETLPVPEIDFDNNSLYKNLVEAIEGKAKQIVTAEQALRVMKLMEAAVKSDKTSEVVKFEK